MSQKSSLLQPAKSVSQALTVDMVATADVTLRRDVVFDLALHFLGAALLGSWDFSMERVDMGLGSVGWRRRN
jgi:hypothetical protein